MGQEGTTRKGPAVACIGDRNRKERAYVHAVEEVGAAGAAVEVPGDDGVLGGGVHAAAPAPEHALPLQPLQEEQPHPRNAPPPLPPDQSTDQLEAARQGGQGKAPVGPGSRLPRKDEKIRNLSLKRWLPRRDGAEKGDGNGVWVAATPTLQQLMSRASA